MPIDIDTKSPAYNKMKADYLALKGYLTPLIRHYFKLSPEMQAAWRADDELLNDFFNFIEDIKL